jgi:hypothetical protein
MPAPLGDQTLETPVIPGAKPTLPKPKIEYEPDKKTASTDESEAPEAVSSNVEVGAPAGAGEIPRLTEQEHVDALQPGSPFYWQDHPNAYAKV